MCGHKSLSSVTIVINSGISFRLYFFIIFINDIDSVCHGQTNIKLFTDDAKLYSEINLNDRL